MFKVIVNIFRKSHEEIDDDGHTKTFYELDQRDEYQSRSKKELELLVDTLQATCSKLPGNRQVRAEYFEVSQ